MENAWIEMKPTFTKHKNDNNVNWASILRWMAKWYRYNGIIEV